jgi:O-antigen/teichoic acid export membrane protein
MRVRKSGHGEEESGGEVIASPAKPASHTLVVPLVIVPPVAVWIWPGNRALDPKDFGLVGMVTAFTGILNLFRDFGLSAAAVQRVKVTEEQGSTLFWINLLVGAALTLLMVAMAPAIAAFYREPRLVWVAVVLASGFIVNAAGVQHSAVLQRQMRFTTMAEIDVLSLVVSIMIGIGMALRGYGYWALVATALVPTMVTTTCLWIAAAWIPGKPQRGMDMRSMLRFGGTLTLDGIVVYLAYNLDKVLLGRWWGAQALGLYGRAYQLVNLPTGNLNNAVGEVAFPALSRVQDDPVRLKRYFLRGYSLVLALTVPITIACALFANDLIPVVLGPKWHDAILIFRLLSPTVLILALINPLTWLLLSLGMVGRNLRVDLVLGPIVIVGCVVGLRYGPVGVALGYSTALTLWFIPHIAWCVHGTVVSLRDILCTAVRPLLSGMMGAAIALGLQFSYEGRLSALPRLVLGNAFLFSVYLAMLLYVFGQKAFYLDLLRGMRDGSPEEKKTGAWWQPDPQLATVQYALRTAQRED